jgi:hypothetical protein
MVNNSQVSTEEDSVITRHNTLAGEEMCSGIVRALLSGDEYIVELNADRRMNATQAPSCLLAPCVGDRVLAYGHGSQGYILAVLERDARCRAELQVPGANDVELSAPSTLTVNSRRLNLRARELTLMARIVTQTGELLSSSFRRIVESVTDKCVAARSLSTRADVRVSDIRDVDTHKAGTLLQTVETVATQKAEISVLAANEDVRIEAKRVTIS